MSTPTKEEITTFLHRLQKRLRAVEKESAKLAEIQTDAQAFETEIAEIGEPDYKNEEAFARLTTLELKVKACRRAIDGQTIKLGEAVYEAARLITPAGHLAGRILRPVADARLETATRALSMFCTTRATALHLARGTEACQSAYWRCNQYESQVSIIPDFVGQGWKNEELRGGYFAHLTDFLPQVVKRVTEYEKILSAAATRSPDLMQFLPFVSAAQGGTPDMSNQLVEPALETTSADDAEDSD